MLKLLNQRISKWAAILFIGDLLILLLSLFIGAYFSPKIDESFIYFCLRYKYSLAILSLNYFIIIYISDLYNHMYDYRDPKIYRRVLFSGFIAGLIAIILFYFPLGRFIGRYFLIIQILSFATLLFIWRYCFSALSLAQRLKKKVLIVGAGSAGRALLQAIQKRENSGLWVKGFADDDVRKIGAEIEGCPVLGNSSDLPVLVKDEQVDLVVVAITHEKPRKLIHSLDEVSWNGCKIIDMPEIYEYLTGKLPVDHFSDIWLFLNSLGKDKLYYKHIKRLLDIWFSLVSLFLSWPIFLSVMVAVKLDSPGRIFFLQKRLGQNQESFNIIKFRTMIEDAEREGPRFASKNDLRITRVGRMLRKFRLDELPQIINILKGDMSFIGPRPEREVFCKEYRTLVSEYRAGRRASDPPESMICVGLKEKVPYYSYRFRVKPGLTGWAQVMYPYASSLEGAKDKLKYELYYIKNMGIILDISILLKTVRIVLSKGGL